MTLLAGDVGGTKTILALVEQSQTRSRGAARDALQPRIPDVRGSDRELSGRRTSRPHRGCVFRHRWPGRRRARHDDESDLTVRRGKAGSSHSDQARPAAERSRRDGGRHARAAAECAAARVATVL